MKFEEVSTWEVREPLDGPDGWPALPRPTSPRLTCGRVIHVYHLRHGDQVGRGPCAGLVTRHVDTTLSRLGAPSTPGTRDYIRVFDHEDASDDQNFRVDNNESISTCGFYRWCWPPKE
jgi:hypothetical protein